MGVSAQTQGVGRDGGRKPWGKEPQNTPARPTGDIMPQTMAASQRAERDSSGGAPKCAESPEIFALAHPGRRRDHRGVPPPGANQGRPARLATVPPQTPSKGRAREGAPLLT